MNRKLGCDLCFRFSIMHVMWPHHGQGVELSPGASVEVKIREDIKRRQTSIALAKASQQTCGAEGGGTLRERKYGEHPGNRASGATRGQYGACAVQHGL